MTTSHSSGLRKLKHFNILFPSIIIIIIFLLQTTTLLTSAQSISFERLDDGYSTFTTRVSLTATVSSEVLIFIALGDSTLWKSLPEPKLIQCSIHEVDAAITTHYTPKLIENTIMTWRGTGTQVFTSKWQFTYEETLNTEIDISCSYFTPLVVPFELKTTDGSSFLSLKAFLSAYDSKSVHLTIPVGVTRIDEQEYSLDVGDLAALLSPETMKLIGYKISIYDAIGITEDVIDPDRIFYSSGLDQNIASLSAEQFTSDFVRVDTSPSSPLWLQFIFSSTFQTEFFVTFTIVQLDSSGNQAGISLETVLHVNPDFKIKTPPIRLIKVERGEITASPDPFQVQYQFEIVPLAPNIGNQQLFFLPVPMKYTRHMYWTECVGQNIDSSLQTSDPTSIGGYYVIKFSPTSTETNVIMTCIAIFSHQAEEIKTWTYDLDYLDIVAFTTSYAPGFAGVISLSPIMDRPADWEVRKLSSYQLNPPQVTIKPFQYGLNPIVGGSPPMSAWTLEFAISGSYFPSLPQLTFPFTHTASQSISVLSLATTWESATNPLNPLTVVGFDATPDASTSGEASFIVQHRLGDSPRIAMGPLYTMSLYVLESPVTPTKIGDDFRLNQSPLSFRLQYEGISTNFDTAVAFPPGHLPTLKTTSTYSGKYDIDPSITSFLVPIVTTINTTPLYFPPNPSSFPVDSIWRTFPHVIIYSGTIIRWVANASGDASFDEEADVSATIGPVPTGWSVQLSPVKLSVFTVTITRTGDDITLLEPLTISTTIGYGSNRKLSWGVAVSVSISMPGSGRNFVSLPSHSFAMGQIPNTEQLGTAKLDFVQWDGSTASLSRVSSPAPSVGQKLYSPAAVEFTTSFTPVTNGFQTQQIDLYYRTSNNQDVLIRSITNANANTITKFTVTRGYTNAYLKLTYKYPVGYAFYTQTTTFFDIISPCITTSATNGSTTPTFASNCPKVEGLNQVCVESLGVCQTVVSADPPLSEKCPECNQSNTASCTIPTTPNSHPVCQCKNGWDGLICAHSTQCSQSKCVADHGYSQIDLTTNKCSSICTCYNQWAGLSCQSCQLQCFHGEAYNDCKRCGCNEGWGGDNCNCMGSVGKITLHGYNDHVISTQGKLSTPLSSNLIEINKDNTVTSYPYPSTLTQDEFAFYSIMSELYHGFLIPLTTSSTGQFTMTARPSVDDPLRTVFNFIILYNCDAANPQLTSEDKLKEQWSEFVKVFSSLEAVQKHFTFPSEPSAEGSDLTPTVEDLPSPDEKLINAGNNSRGVDVILMMMIIMTLMMIM